jgi:two-component system sensor histidine kinase EvgS
MMSYEWRNRKLPVPGFMDRHAHIFYLVFVGLLTLALVLLYRNRMFKRLARAEQASRQQLEAHVRFIRALGESLPHPIVVRDKSGKVLLCNSKYLTQLGAEPKAMGQPFAQGLSGCSMQTSPCWSRTLPGCCRRAAHLCGSHLPSQGTQSDIYHWMVPYFDGEGPSAG